MLPFICKTVYIYIFFLSQVPPSLYFRMTKYLKFINICLTLCSVQKYFKFIIKSVIQG